jgi:hypothetical protein
MWFAIRISVIFWLSIFTITWLAIDYFDPGNPLSSGLMMIVFLALVVAWICQIEEIIELWQDIPD